jgi:hexosaminidase
MKFYQYFSFKFLRGCLNTKTYVIARHEAIANCACSPCIACDCFVLRNDNFYSINKLKELLTGASIILLFTILNISTAKAQLNIIPQPVSVVQEDGSFLIKPSITIAVTKENELVGNYLQQYLMNTYGIGLKVKVYEHIPQSAAIKLENRQEDAIKGSYAMTVSPKSIRIDGNGAGAFYGVQSLIQLINAESNKQLSVASCKIEDHPRFGWRGLSLDVCRHFFTVADVKKYIDMMAHYKLDILHWHLTDDEGWRIQIDKYPLLTEKASRINYYANLGQYRKLDNLVGGGSDGFYTKDQIREVIKYAQDRFITILPEIEMPGHSEEAIFAYPQLGCKDTTGAIHRERVLDPSEYTFNFYENVLTEVMDLFPDKYIHIGGDEAEVTDWLKSPVAVALMKREHYTDPSQVQSYFIRRIEAFVNSKGRKIVGWDEILKGGLAPSATVMSWEGEEGGIIAAKMHHDVIMTPLPQMYFDAPQANALTEPIGWNDPVSWQMVYNYEPQSPQLSEEDAKYILGAQANIWTEKIPTFKQLEYMIYPRLLAEAELTWTPKADKNIKRFEQAMYANYRLFNLWHLNARLPNAEGLKDVVTNKNEYTQTLTYPLANALVQYSLNGKLPDTSGVKGHYPVTINSPLKDTLAVAVYTTRPLSQRILQVAMIRHINVKPYAVNENRLEPGLNYMAYRTNYSNIPIADTAKDFAMGVMRKDDHIKPYPGQFNTWVKFSGYLRIEKEGDYHIASGFETSPMLLMGMTLILDGTKNKYIEPQEALLHLTKGVYQLSGYYLADTTNEKQSLITITDSEGRTVEASAYLFH